MCGSIRAGPSAKCAARRSRCRVRSSGACPPWPVRNGGKRSATACSSTTTRTRRTARRARHIRCARSPTRACPRRFTGTRFPTASPADFTVLTVPKRFAELGDPHADMDAAPGSLEKLLELAAQRRSRGSRRRTLAAALSQDGGRIAAGRPFTRQVRRKEAANEDAAVSLNPKINQAARWYATRS